MAIKELAAKAALENLGGNIIEKSFCQAADGWLALVITAEGQKLLGYVFSGETAASRLFKAEKTVAEKNLKCMLMPLNSNNAAVVRRYVKWTAPSACGAKGTSIGFSDWLGVAGAEVTDLFVNKQMKPVLVEYTAADSLAVQRNLLEAVDTATWGVLEKGYKEGYGANAAGLVEEQDIVKALLYGYSMIGIDCSDKINLDIEKLTDEQVEAKFDEFNDVFKAAVNASYLKVEFKVGNNKISFGENELHRIILEYGEAIMHIQFLYNSYLKSTPWDIDFELSLSKPGKTLSPQEHYLIANELQRNGIKLAAVCLDALNEKAELQKDLAVHAAIADTYGYRLSLKNADLGLPDAAAVVKETKGKVHFKLNNILWMSAVKLIATQDPELYQKIVSAAGLEAVPAKAICGTDACQAFACSYKQVLSQNAGNLAVAIKEFLTANQEAYLQAVKSNVQAGFLQRL